MVTRGAGMAHPRVSFLWMRLLPLGGLEPRVPPARLRPSFRRRRTSALLLKEVLLSAFAGEGLPHPVNFVVVTKHVSDKSNTARIRS